jgi:thymidine kinase
MERRGNFQVICGCMFSGKTEELIRRIKREMYAKNNVLVFKSHHTAKYSFEKIKTHEGQSINALPIKDSLTQNLEKLLKDYKKRSIVFDVIAIDEIHFFDEEIVEFCNRLADSGKKIIVAGLDLDFRGEPFSKTIKLLLAKADHVDKLTAVCSICGGVATRSQRFIDGEPAKWNEATIVISGMEKYAPVCRKHHKINRPNM